MNLSYIKLGIHLFFNGLKQAVTMARFARILSNVRMPMITVFGSARVSQDSFWYKQAFLLSKNVAAHGISVMTGGGPGIMDAANCGAFKENDLRDGKENTVGICVVGVDASFKSSCDHMFWVNDFLMRKWMLVRYSQGLIVFPGGLGTIDELTDVLNYMKHKQITHIPLILIGVDYWQPITDWIKQGIKEKFIREETLKYCIVTDDLETAEKILIDACKQNIKNTI